MACIQLGIMGTVRPFNDPSRPLEAEALAQIGSPQLYVMPAPQQQPVNDGLPFPVAGAGGKLIYMPARWSVASAPIKPRRQYRSNAVEYWPKGYPTHDDL